MLFRPKELIKNLKVNACKCLVKKNLRIKFFFSYYLQKRILHLPSLHFTGIIPALLGDLNKMKILALSSNSFTGDELTYMLNKDWSETVLVTIPSSIASLTTLQELYLHSNRFSGAHEGWGNDFDWENFRKWNYHRWTGI
jgi:hypothetical protein